MIKIEEQVIEELTTDFCKAIAKILINEEETNDKGTK